MFLISFLPINVFIHSFIVALEDLRSKARTPYTAGLLVNNRILSAEMLDCHTAFGNQRSLGVAYNNQIRVARCPVELTSARRTRITVSTAYGGREWSAGAVDGDFPCNEFIARAAQWLEKIGHRDECQRGGIAYWFAAVSDARWPVTGVYAIILHCPYRPA